MITVDLIVIVTLAVFTLLGLMKGLIQEVGSILGLFVGFFIAGKFAWPVAQYIRGGFAQYPMIADPLSYIAGFFLVFFVATFIFGFFVKVLDKMFNMFVVFPFLKTINRIGGAVLGAAEGALFIAVTVYMLVALPINPGLTKNINESWSGPIFLSLANAVKPLLPDFAEIDLKKLLPTYTPPTGTTIPANQN